MNLQEEIIEFLNTEIDPYVRSHNGSITFDRFEEGIVFVKLSGSCSNCSAASLTLSMLIERQIRKKFREVKKVRSID